MVLTDLIYLSDRNEIYTHTYKKGKFIKKKKIRVIKSIKIFFKFLQKVLWIKKLLKNSSQTVKWVNITQKIYIHKNFHF